MKSFKKYGLYPIGATPNERQFAHMHYKKAFFHFGVNTFSDLEWGKGTELEESFNPTELDCRQWMRTIKAAGFDLAIITTKHHDGFCLWPSEFTDHSIKNSPYKNGKGDIIREFTDAAHEYGIKVGIYMSPWDRNSEYWGKPEYSKYYAKQLTEVLTNYGEIEEVWWDGAGSTETVYDWGLWAYIVRNYQPKAAIFGSLGATPYIDLHWIGNEAGIAGETHYASINVDAINKETRPILNTGTFGGVRYIPAETDVSIRPGWFYHSSQDTQVKSVSRLNRLWFESVGRNTMLLLNFPPDRRGLICDTDAENALKSHYDIQKMLNTNYADFAKITADNVYRNCTIDKAVLDDEDLFFASENNEVTIDISFKEPTLLNVLILSEEIRLGERITEFYLENPDEQNKIIAKGTSVGFKKAVIFEEKKYSNLRLHIKSPVGNIVLNHLGLYYFSEDKSQTNTENSKNIADLVSTKVEFSDDRKVATIAFGGVYPFSFVKFKADEESKCKLYAFSGTNWELISEFECKNRFAEWKSNKEISGSYQIKIESEKPLPEFPDFEIR